MQNKNNTYFFPLNKKEAFHLSISGIFIHPFLAFLIMKHEAMARQFSTIVIVIAVSKMYGHCLKDQDGQPTTMWQTNQDSTKNKEKDKQKFQE